MDVAYITPQQESETCKVYNSRLYTTMVTFLSKMPELPAMRVTRLWPSTDWASVWHNLHETPVP
jgi:hypothetical protein